jgi:hypothetical protein
MVGVFPIYSHASSQQLLGLTLFSQQVEAKIGCKVLHRMTSFGMPATKRSVEAPAESHALPRQVRTTVSDATWVLILTYMTSL